MEQASIERNTYDSVWYVQDIEGESPPHRVAEGGVPLRDSAGISMPVPAVWSPDGQWIYFRALIDGQIAIWRAAANGSGTESVTLDSANVRDFVLSADGKTLKYSIGPTREEEVQAEQVEYDRGIHINETVPIGQPLFRSGNIEGRLATQRFGGKWFDRASLLSGVSERWKAVDLSTGLSFDVILSDHPSRPLTTSDLAKQNLPEPWKLAVEEGGSRIALLTRFGHMDGHRDKPDVQLAMLPNKRARTLIQCQAELCRGKAITNIQWRPSSDEVLFTVTDPHEGLAQSIFRWNVKTGIVHLVSHSKGLISGDRDFYNVSSCGISRDSAVCVIAEADRPPWLERIDLDTGHRKMLFDPNEALTQDIAATVPARLLRWTNTQGLEFTGQFFPARRIGFMPPPLFINYYRCKGFLRGGVGDEWPLASLAEKGISALCINAPPSRLDAVERYDLGMSAIESVVTLLASRGEIDRTKVGMGGLSFGSEVTFWTLMKSDLLAAASITSPFASPNYYLFGSLKGDDFFSGLKEFWQLGSPDETPERWRMLSPLFNLNEIQAPILMQMPEQEYMEASDYAIPLMRKRQADLYVFPNEPHQKFQPKHKLAAYERNLDWFRFWLQGYEDPDPNKNDQYKYWHLMKANFLHESMTFKGQDYR